MTDLWTAYVFHILNLVFHQIEDKEKNDDDILEQENAGKAVSLSNVFELVEALEESKIESSIKRLVN